MSNASLDAAIDSPFHDFESFNAKIAWEKAHGKRALSDDEESSSEDALAIPPEEEDTWIDESAVLLLRDEFKGNNAQYIVHFVKHLIRMWRDAPEQKNAASVMGLGECQLIDIQRVVSTMKHFIEELPTMTRGAIDKLHQYVVEIVNGDYSQATQSYLDITIGKTKWHQDVSCGEARSNQGYNWRKVFRKFGTEFAEAISNAPATDTGIEAYMLCLKRLQTKAQELRPNSIQVTPHALHSVKTASV